MNKLLTTVAIVASLVTATSSAHAGIFGDVARAANRVGGAAKQVERDSRPAQQGTASPYSWMSNKGYMQCLHGMQAFARNDAEAQQGVRNCNQQFGSR